MPNGQTLAFDSAVIYQNSEGGGLSRIVAKYVSHAQTVLVESRPSESGPVTKVLAGDRSGNVSPVR